MNTQDQVAEFDKKCFGLKLGTAAFNVLGCCGNADTLTLDTSVVFSVGLLAVTGPELRLLVLGYYGQPAAGPAGFGAPRRPGERPADGDSWWWTPTAAARRRKMRKMPKRD